jgi:hypothetical protein
MTAAHMIEPSGRPIGGSGLRRRRVAAWLLGGLLGFSLLAAYVQYRRMVRPTVPRVAEMATVGLDAHPRVALARTVDGLGFPRWKDSGFAAIGGSTFTIRDRAAATVVYARGAQRISYTIVSGADHINYAAVTTTSYRRVRGRQVELNWIGMPGAVLTFKRNSRTVVMTGTPATPGLARTMSTLATQP